MDVDTSEDFTLFIGGTCIGIILATFPFYSKRWSVLLRKITNFNVFGKPPGTEKTINFHYYVTILFRVYCFIGAILYGITSLYEAKECYELKAKADINIICLSMIPMWLPIEISIFTEWTIFCFQFIILQFGIIPAGSICLLIWEVANMLILHIELLKVTIENIMLEKIRKQRRKLLILWISYHLQVLKIIREFNFLTKSCVGIFSFMAALVLACIMNQFVNMNKPIGACIYLLGWLMALYILCHAGQIIQDGTESIGMAAYNSNWYSVDIDTQKDVLFIIRQCQKPSYLQALPLGEFNHSLMLMILKTSYSFLTFLTQTT